MKNPCRQQAHQPNSSGTKRGLREATEPGDGELCRVQSSSAAFWIHSMVSLPGFWRNHLLFLHFLLPLSAFSSAEICLHHPAQCPILSQIRHTLRLGAILPTRQPARIQNALNRALASIRHQSTGADPISTTSSQPAPLLPFNLTLEMVARSPAGWDPESLFHSACHDLVIRGVSAVLAFPHSREELIQLEFLSSFLEIPFISILEDTEPLVTKVLTACVCFRVLWHL